MRNRRLSIALVVPIVLLLGVTSGPAFATPLQSVQASAYGLTATGILPIAPTPTVSASFPPAADNQRSDLLRLPADPLVFSGTATVRAITTTNSTLQAAVPAGFLRVQGGGAIPAGFNARGYARTEGLSVGSANPVTADTNDILEPALVAVGAVEAEALVSCVNGQPVYVTGSRLVGPLTVAGLDLGDAVNQLVTGVVDTVNVPGVATLRRNVVTPTANGGVEVIGLQINLLGSGVEVRVSEAKVDGSRCGDAPECSDGIDNDGDGRIDIRDPECHTDGNADNPASYDPNDDSEAGLLPRTGGSSPLLGAMIFALGAALLVGVRKLRRSEIS